MTNYFLKNLFFHEKYNYLRLLVFDVLLFLILQSLTNYLPIEFLLIIIAIISYILTYKFLNYILHNLIYAKQSQHELSKFDEKLYKIIFENKLLYELFIETKFKKQVTNVDDAVIKTEIKNFMKKFSKTFIQAWYKPYISDDEQFINEAQLQLELIGFDLFKRVSCLNKLNFFRYFAHVFNNYFINFTERNLSTANIDINLLHEALHNLPKSEIEHIKNYVKIILNKSAPPELYINDAFIEEIFMQIIGKNCFEKLINLISQPSFLYYSIVLLCNKKFEFEKENETVVDTDVKNINETSFNLNDATNESIDGKSIDSLSLILDVDDNSSLLQRKSESESEYSFNLNSQLDNSEKLTQSDIQNLNQKQDLRNLIEIIEIKVIDTETDYEPKSGDPFTVYIIQVYLLFFDFNFFFYT